MKNIAKSIRERLLNLAKAQDQNFNTLLTKYMSWQIINHSHFIPHDPSLD